MPPGYGRQEVAQLLLSAGAKMEALNEAKQTPLDVAKLNKEVRRLWRDCSGGLLQEEWQRECSRGRGRSGISGGVRWEVQGEWQM